MRDREKLVRRICLGVICFLALYCGCLVFSRYTGTEIVWAQWIQQKIVEGCLSVSQPVLGKVPEQEQTNITWQDGILNLVGAVLDWPVVEEPDAESDKTGYTGDTSAGAGNDITRAQSMEESIADLKQEEEETREEVPKETQQETAAETVAENSLSPSIPAESEGAVQESGQAAEASATVLPQNTPSLLPVGEGIRQEILQLPAIAGLDTNQMLDYGYLLQKLYVVNSGCNVTEEVLNPQTLLSKDLTITHETEGYEILIYHTHSQEAFADSVPGDVSQTVVGLGDYLTALLQEKGYRVLHHTGIYDMENGVLERDYAYDRALPALEQILAENPSIQVVIDLHRDGVAEDVHLITDVNGEQTARLMFFNGMCRNETGERTDVTNPYREDNLAFSLQSALQLEAYYPGMLRVVYLKQSRYNQHLRSRSMLVEVGAQTNTVAEVYRTIPVLADVLSKVLQ